MVLNIGQVRNVLHASQQAIVHSAKATNQTAQKIKEVVEGVTVPSVPDPTTVSEIAAEAAKTSVKAPIAEAQNVLPSKVSDSSVVTEAPKTSVEEPIAEAQNILPSKVSDSSVVAEAPKTSVEEPIAEVQNILPSKVSDSSVVTEAPKASVEAPSETTASTETAAPVKKTGLPNVQELTLDAFIKTTQEADFPQVLKNAFRAELLERETHLLHHIREVGEGKAWGSFQTFEALIKENIPDLKPVEAVARGHRLDQLRQAFGERGESLNATFAKLVQSPFKKYRDRVKELIAPVVGARHVAVAALKEPAHRTFFNDAVKKYF